MRQAGYRTAVAGKWQINDLRVNDALTLHGFDEHCVWPGYETGKVDFATVLDAQGGGSIAIPMPSFAPYQSVLLHAQWLIANPNAAGCAAYGLDLSNEKTTLPIW